MQEEVENRTVNLAISTTKLTFRTIVNGYNAWKRHHQAKVAQKTAQLPVGKQSIKELIGQNQGVSSIPIEKRMDWRLRNMPMDWMIRRLCVPIMSPQ